MLNISSILNNDAFTREEQLEIVRYMDAQLEQMELLLCRLDQLARQASEDGTLDAERRRLQTKVNQIQKEIDRISERFPRTFIMENGL